VSGILLLQPFSAPVNGLRFCISKVKQPGNLNLTWKPAVSVKILETAKMELNFRCKCWQIVLEGMNLCTVLYRSTM
jgi:hypothetical protein